MGYLSSVLTALYYIAYPIFFILSLFLSLLVIITAPLQHLGHYFVYGLWYPIHFLGKFETLYIFFSVAVIVGVLTGTSLHYVFSFMISLFDMESQAQEPRGRTLASYRTEKQRQQKLDGPLTKAEHRGEALPIDDAAQKEEYMDWAWTNKDIGKGRNGLINTILEEDSTEDGF